MLLQATDATGVKPVAESAAAVAAASCSSHCHCLEVTSKYVFEFTLLNVLDVFNLIYIKTIFIKFRNIIFGRLLFMHVYTL